MDLSIFDDNNTASHIPIVADGNGVADEEDVFELCDWHGSDQLSKSSAISATLPGALPSLKPVADSAFIAPLAHSSVIPDLFGKPSISTVSPEKGADEFVDSIFSDDDDCLDLGSTNHEFPLSAMMKTEQSEDVAETDEAILELPEDKDLFASSESESNSPEPLDSMTAPCTRGSSVNPNTLIQSIFGSDEDDQAQEGDDEGVSVAQRLNIASEAKLNEPSVSIPSIDARVSAISEHLKVEMEQVAVLTAKNSFPKHVSASSLGHQPYAQDHQNTIKTKLHAQVDQSPKKAISSEPLPADKQEQAEKEEPAKKTIPTFSLIPAKTKSIALVPEQ